MNNQLVDLGHLPECVVRILNNCWQCGSRFGLGICDQGDKCDRVNPYP